MVFTYEAAGQRITTYYPLSNTSPNASKDIPASQIARQQLNRDIRDGNKEPPKSFLQKVVQGAVTTSAMIESARSAIRQHGENNPWVTGIGVGSMVPQQPEEEDKDQPRRKKQHKKKPATRKKKCRSQRQAEDEPEDDRPFMERMWDVPPELKRFM